MARLLCCVLVVSALLLMSGCAGTFQPPRYKVPVVSYEYGIGPTGPTSVLSLKMDGREMIRTPWFGSTPLDGRQDTEPCHTAYSLSPKGIFDIPRTLEVTWYLYTYEQLYHTVITTPAKREMQKILKQMGMETPREIRFGVYIYAAAGKVLHRHPLDAVSKPVQAPSACHRQGQPHSQHRF